MAYFHEKAIGGAQIAQDDEKPFQDPTSN